MKRKCQQSLFSLFEERVFSSDVPFSFQEVLAEQPSRKKVEEKPNLSKSKKEEEPVANIAVEE